MNCSWTSSKEVQEFGNIQIFATKIWTCSWTYFWTCSWTVQHKQHRYNGAAVQRRLWVARSHSCDGWVCDLGAVGASLIFGLIRGSVAFAAVLPTFVLVSRMQLVEQYRGNGHFLSQVFSSWHEAMVGDSLSRAWTVFLVCSISRFIINNPWYNSRT